MPCTAFLFFARPPERVLSGGELGEKCVIRIESREGDKLVESNVKATPEELLAKANANDAAAMYEAARNYYSGKCGFEEDDDKAFFWAQKAVETAPDEPDHWDLLARCYSFGVGTGKSHAKAIGAWLKAAELGDADSMYSLAEELFYSDKPSEQERSVYWLNKAIAGGSLEAMALRGYMYLEGKCGERNLHKGVDLLTKAAYGGDVEASRLLGEFYHNGKYIPEDSSKTGYYYTRAVELGTDDSRAIYYAGLAWFHGIGVEKNFQKARQCFERFSYAPDANAIMGCMCFEGVGGSVDRAKGEERLRMAMNGADPDIALKAKNSLGMYLYNDSSRLGEAIDLFRDAADSGDSDAQVNLGRAFYEGKGVEQNTGKAVYYWRSAAAQGNSTAISNLRAIGEKFSGEEYQFSQQGKQTGEFGEPAGEYNGALWLLPVFITLSFVLFWIQMSLS